MRHVGVELSTEEDLELTEAGDRYEALDPVAAAQDLLAGRLHR